MGRGLKIFLAIVALLAVVLAFNTVAVNRETKAAGARDGGRLLELPGGTLNVHDDGDPNGRPIVLLHGFASSSRWWDAILPHLSDGHRVIRIDSLGHGGSEKPSGGYSVQEQARLVALALGELEVEGAFVVGHSMGGRIATALAAGHSELVDRLAVIGTAPVEGFSSLPFTARLVRVPVIGQAIWRVTPDSRVESGLGSAFAPGYEVPDRFVEDFRAMTYTSYDSSQEQSERYTKQKPLDVRVSEAGVPLMVIFGELDDITDAEAAQAWNQVPGVRITTLPRIGHSPQVEVPERTARLLLEFAEDPGDEEHSPE